MSNSQKVVKSVRNIFGYSICFSLGMVAAMLLAPIWNFASQFVFGFEIHGKASYPTHHMARLFSRPGIGDQTFRLQVDGTTVWVSPDLQSGNVEEDIYWDESGQLVTIEIDCEKRVVYNATTQKIEFEEN